ncbi:MAG: hypothetical protein ACOC1X_01815 [Promethearchaeota archaeon]
MTTGYERQKQKWKEQGKQEERERIKRLKKEICKVAIKYNFEFDLHEKIENKFKEYGIGDGK